MDNKFVAIDLGASETRYMTNFSHVGEIRIVPNATVFVDSDTKVDLMVDTSDIMKCLDVSISSKEGESLFFPLRSIIGEMALKYRPVQEKPSGDSFKSEQRVNYSSILATCALALEDSTDDVNNIDLYIAMPPLEAKNKKEFIQEQLKNEYVVRFNKLDKEIKINIVDVEVYEESFLAMLSFLYNENATPTELADKYSEGYILSLDIGASTTDIVAVRDGEYLEHSGKTIKTGGNVVRDYLIDAVVGSRGLEISPEMAAKGVEEGRVRDGNSWMSISQELAIAKEAYADDVVYQLDTYFRGKKIPLQNFRAICVSGGGAQESGYTNESNDFIKTTEPMSFFITKKLIEKSRFIEVESYRGNPREANIRGLFIRAKLDQLSKGKISLDDF